MARRPLAGTSVPVPRPPHVVLTPGAPPSLCASHQGCSAGTTPITTLPNLPLSSNPRRTLLKAYICYCIMRYDRNILANSK